ncbi:LOW QUALITY PROTEIN: NEDD4 family-interacting protein 1-like [Petromyzon marinus]|uniref:LOW QUALITY PROTEIN: NEDD4 family-interacting protein 1-like n=1 Tax=Petromyzon marinus TaxID=7757 RepID=UPI003F726D51
MESGSSARYQALQTEEEEGGPGPSSLQCGGWGLWGCLRRGRGLPAPPPAPPGAPLPPCAPLPRSLGPAPLQGGAANPPAYSVATSLPSYDEAEKSKAGGPAGGLGGGSSGGVVVGGGVVGGGVGGGVGVGTAAERDDDFSPREDFDDADQLRIGNDGIFMVSFFMSFLFNWIGFFLSFCLTNTVAGRYGAISGFGLSLVKWIIIVRFSEYFAGYFDGQYWLWWIFLMLGLLLFLRGFLNYLKVRKMSDELASLSRARLLFVY